MGKNLTSACRRFIEECAQVAEHGRQKPMIALVKLHGREGTKRDYLLGFEVRYHLISVPAKNGPSHDLKQRDEPVFSQEDGP
jgi:hypothetical protein